MSVIDRAKEVFEEMEKIAIKALNKELEEVQKHYSELLEIAQQDIANCRTTGVLTFKIGSADSTDKEERPRGRPRKNTNSSNRSDSSKENEPETRESTTRSSRLRKTTKQHPFEENSATGSNNLIVKLERLTEDFQNKHCNDIPTNIKVNIKSEATEMPPPARLPVRHTRKRKVAGYTNNLENGDGGSIRVKQELMESESKKRTLTAKSDELKRKPSTYRDSDVQLQVAKVPVVAVLDSDEDEPEERLTRTRARTKNRNNQAKVKKVDCDEGSRTEEEKEVVSSGRVTRTKTRNQDKEKNALDEAEAGGVRKPDITEPVRSTFTKTRNGAKNNEHKSNQESTIDGLNVTQIVNQTIIISKPAVLNNTVIIEKPKNLALTNNHDELINNDLMTDDEDVFTSPVSNKKPNKIKPVFSPYSESPVKKRVQAFEKLGAEANVDLPQPLTRTKKKLQELEENTNPTGKATPSSNSRHAAIPRLIKSAVKPTLAELRERALKHKQKESDALVKKEALIQAQIDEKRRRREERQLKAQQARDALEMEKQKLQESAERLKMEKAKQVLAEKEEKLKQREEAARKRALVLKKAADEKHREDKRREQLRNEGKPERKGLPPYMTNPAPFLPTPDCYDSDDPEGDKPFNPPHWQQKVTLNYKLRLMHYNCNKQALFCGTRTVDLREIFPSIEAHKLKRTSSAIWNRSGLLKLASMAEESDSI